MFEASGGIINFLAILIPTVMGLYYGFRCLFQTDAAIEQWGIGAGSAWMVRFAGVCVGAQNLVYAILLLTTPAGAWALFAYGTIQAALFTLLAVYATSMNFSILEIPPFCK